jgi:hypothetical protein
MLNAVPTRGGIGAEARERLRRERIPVIEATLSQRVAYAHAVIDGRAVHEYEPHGKAAGEMDTVFEWLRHASTLQPLIGHNDQIIFTEDSYGKPET